MLRLVLVYASSMGLQRAMVFLAAPLLSNSFPIEAIGLYTLIQTTAQFAIPLLTWNATVALTREAIDHPAASLKLLRRLCLAAVAVGLLGLLLTAIPAIPAWIAFGLALGAAEAAFAAAVAILQGREAANKLLIVSVSKTFGFLVIIGAVILIKLRIEYLFIAQIANSSIAAAITFSVARRILQGEIETGQGITVREMLRYSAATLPHTAALWLSVSSDRLLLGAFKGKAEVGSYALAYTVAQAVALAMSGVIAALPPRIARDPKSWREPDHVKRFIYSITGAAFLIIMAMFGFLLFNRHVVTLIDKMPDNAFMLVALIGMGFYASVYYVLFASYMYLNRTTDALARSGFIVGPINLLFMAFMVHQFGGLGAAAGLLFCYAGFGVAYGRVSLALEPSLRLAVRPVLIAIACLFVSVLGVAMLLS